MIEFGGTMLTLRIIKARSHNGLLEPVANDGVRCYLFVRGRDVPMDSSSPVLAVLPIT